jgi:hypothetical protein
MNEATLEIAFKEWWEASYGRPPGTHAVMTHVAFAAHMLTLLEFMQPCEYIVTSDEGTSYCSLAEQAAKPTPNDRQIRTSLIKRVHSCIVGEPSVGHMQARAAIREVNAWLRERAGGTRASWLLDNEVEQ